MRGVEATEFLQGLSLLHTFDCRKKDLAQGKVGKQATGVSAKREAVLALPLAAYEQWKEPLEKGFWQAAKFLRKESFFSPNDLPYRTQLVPLAAVLALMGDRWMEQRVYERLSRWFWCGVLGELYGGAVESRMALDVPELVAWLDGADMEPTRRYNSILNKTPISYKANRMIGGRSPSEYLKQLQGHKAATQRRRR